MGATMRDGGGRRWWEVEESVRLSTTLTARSSSTADAAMLTGGRDVMVKREGG